MADTKCDISKCLLASQWNITEPMDCLVCDDESNCGYKIVDRYEDVGLGEYP